MNAANSELNQFDKRAEELTKLKLKLFEKEHESVTLSSECEKRVQEMQASLKEITQMKEAAVAHLTQKLEEEEAKIASLQLDCRDLNSKHANISAAIQVPESLYEMVPGDQRKSYIERLVRLHQDRNGSLNLSFSNASGRSTEIQHLQHQVNELKEQVQEKESRCKQLDEELDDVVQHFENRIASYRSEMAGMPAKILALEASNEKLSAENKTLSRQQQSVDRLQEEKQRLEESVVQLQNESKSTHGMKEAVSSCGSEQSAELKECRLKLSEKETECQELEDAVHHYEQQIALYKTDRKNLKSQLNTLQAENKAKSEEHATIATKMASLEMKVRSEHEEKERLQGILLETQGAKKKLEEELSAMKTLKSSGQVTPDNGGVLKSSSSQRAAREQQVAQFESLSNAEKEIKELREKLHFAETKATRYREELRRLQNSAPLDSTVCQLRSTGGGPIAAAGGGGTAAKPPPTLTLSSPEVSKLQSGNKESPPFSYEVGSHMVLSSQVLELRRDVYQLEKTKKSLESENKSVNHYLSHYKTKAQEWKTSSLAHQRAVAKLKDEVGRLKKMLEASGKASSLITAERQTENYQSLCDVRSKTSSYLKATPAQDGKPRDALKERNSIRGGRDAKQDYARKGAQASENVPPSDASVTSPKESALARNRPNISAVSNKSSGTAAYSSKHNAADSRSLQHSAFKTPSMKAISSTEQDSSTSKPLTLSAAIIKSLSPQGIAVSQNSDSMSSSAYFRLDSKEQSVDEAGSDSVQYSRRGVTVASQGPGRMHESSASASPGYSSNLGRHSGGRTRNESNAKYYLPESKRKIDDDCKTQ